VSSRAYVFEQEHTRRRYGRTSTREESRHWRGTPTAFTPSLLIPHPSFNPQFLEIARHTKQICDKYNVPLFINDRVDIALAVGATGLHLGQTDMPVAVARKLLDLAHSGE
jgi:hypothetical protein